MSEFSDTVGFIVKAIMIFAVGVLLFLKFNTTVDGDIPCSIFYTGDQLCETRQF